jgi:hypothetical protein
VVCSQTSGGGGGGTEGCAATSCSLMICQTAPSHPVIICRSRDGRGLIFFSFLQLYVYVSRSSADRYLASWVLEYFKSQVCIFSCRGPAKTAFHFLGLIGSIPKLTTPPPPGGGCTSFFHIRRKTVRSYLSVSGQPQSKLYS